MDADISLSVLGLPCGPPNRSSALSMRMLVRITAMMPITRLRFLPFEIFHRVATDSVL
jgi:hypothetical protein